VSCVLVAAWPTRSPGQAPVCDGYETFLGEGEVPWAQIVAWSHTTAQIWMPAGVGKRSVYVSVGGQTPAVPAAPYANWAFAPPALRLVTVEAASLSPVGGYMLPPGAISTDGGTVVVLQVRWGRGG
jgi:hypothetical protein